MFLPGFLRRLRTSTGSKWGIRVYPAGYAFKATIPRAVPAGDIGDTDVYGAQQHAPVLDVEVPL